MTDQYQNPQSSHSYLSIPKIRVIVRKRPLSKKEQLKNESDIVDIRNNCQVIVKELKTKVDLTKFIEEHAFKFDLAFDKEKTNEQIYIEAVRPMIEASFNKTKVTCFAYGQTGSGKTYTMMGSGFEMGTPGLYLLAAYDIFTLLQQDQYKGFTILASFYEIYCGKLFDLLNKRKLLEVREDGKQNICIIGLTERKVESLQTLMQLINFGIKVRTVGVTGANSDSSRSHGIIQIVIKNSFDNQHGKISFIDLAGSERAADTIDTNRQTRIDGAEINKSLLALKECIRALDQDKKHTPFRGSKLTLVLRDSFVGNCKTLMIANISPSLGCSEHTLNTLRYADRVKELRGKGEINIGNGNVNLNYDSNANRERNLGKNQEEYLANLLMMPRQHNKTVKYNVDNNMKRVSDRKVKRNFRQQKNSNNINNNGENNRQMGINSIVNNIPPINCNSFSVVMNNNNGYMGMMNIEANNNSNNINMQNIPNSSYSSYQMQLNQNSNGIHQLENKENISNENNFKMQSYSINQNEMSNTNTKVIMNNMIQNNELMQMNPLQESLYDNNINDVFSFLNDYSSFTQKQEMENKQQQENNDKDLNALKEKYENLVNKIFTEEKNFIDLHKSHIDQMVSTMKTEMNLIGMVEKQENIGEYVDSVINVFSSQLEKVAAMKKRIIDFKMLLKEESELNAKISQLRNIY